MPRRELLRQSLGLVGVAPLCCFTPEVPLDCISYEGSTLIIDLTRASLLRPVGAAGVVVDSRRSLNIIVAHTDRKRFVALDRTCTHGGAQCAYIHRSRTLQCTSLNHAEYDLDGVLLHGRTHGNLRAYRTRSRGPRLEIELEKKA